MPGEVMTRVLRAVDRQRLLTRLIPLVGVATASLYMTVHRNPFFLIGSASDPSIVPRAISILSVTMTKNRPLGLAFSPTLRHSKSTYAHPESSDFVLSLRNFETSFNDTTFSRESNDSTAHFHAPFFDFTLTIGLSLRADVSATERLGGFEILQTWVLPQLTWTMNRETVLGNP